MKKSGMRRGPLAVRLADHHGDFFRVLQQTVRSQTAVMTVAPGQDAGPAETHAADQIVYVIEGEAEMRVGEERCLAGPGSLVTIPTGHPTTCAASEPSRSSSSPSTRRRRIRAPEEVGDTRRHRARVVSLDEAAPLELAPPISRAFRGVVPARQRA